MYTHVSSRLAISAASRGRWPSLYCPTLQAHPNAPHRVAKGRQAGALNQPSLPQAGCRVRCNAPRW